MKCISTSWVSTEIKISNNLCAIVAHNIVQYMLQNMGFLLLYMLQTSTPEIYHLNIRLIVGTIKTKADGKD